MSCGRVVHCKWGCWLLVPLQFPLALFTEPVQPEGTETYTSSDLDVTRHMGGLELLQSRALSFRESCLPAHTCTDGETKAQGSEGPRARSRDENSSVWPSVQSTGSQSERLPGQQPQHPQGPCYKSKISAPAGSKTLGEDHSLGFIKPSGILVHTKFKTTHISAFCVTALTDLRPVGGTVSCDVPHLVLLSSP